MTDTLDRASSSVQPSSKGASATGRPRRPVRIAPDPSPETRQGDVGADPVADVFVRSLVCSIDEHEKCDGSAAGAICKCRCHASLDGVYKPPAIEEDAADLLDVVTASPYRFEYGGAPGNQRFGDSAASDPPLPVTSASKRYKRHTESVINAFGNLPEESQRNGVEIFESRVSGGERPAYAALNTRREMAASLLACGATNEEAALYAGVSYQTVSAWKAEPVFRTRVEELQSTIMGSITGNLLAELQRRTQGKHLRKMGLNDLLRVFDRVAGTRAAGGARGAAAAARVDVNVTVSNYEAILGRLFDPNAQSLGADDASPESGDFPVYGAGVVPLPGGSALRSGEVPPAGSRETRGEE